MSDVRESLAPALRSLRAGGMPPGVNLERWTEQALGLAWRLLHAEAREAFLAKQPPPLRRLSWVADDGVGGALFHLPAAPGSTGEPVLLAHGLGAGWRAFALGEASLARKLSRAGFSVYLLAHRGDADATPCSGFTLDDIAERDLPAAIAAILADSGASRVLAVGHGCGGHAWLLHRALLGGAEVAALALLGTPGRFRPSSASSRAAALLLAHLPAGWALPPTRPLRWVTPFLADGSALGSPDTPGPEARAWARALEGGLSGGVLAQVARWHALEHLTDATGRLDVLAAQTPLPSVVVAGREDPACLPEDALPVASALGAEMLDVAGGHLDVLWGREAGERATEALLSLFHAHRARCWEVGGEGRSVPRTAG